MKQACKVLAIVVFLFGVAGQVAAQKVAPPYSIGIRANPDGAGISAKYFFNENINIDAMLNSSRGASGYRYHSTVFLGLVEYNFLLANPSWRIFVGPGVHVGGQKQFKYLYGEYPQASQAIFGFDMIGGVEYVFDYVPVGISVDVKPAVNFYNGISAFPNNTLGLGVRYYFGKWTSKPDPIQSGR